MKSGMEKKTSTDRVRAFRERKRANKPPKKEPASTLERSRKYRARQRALKKYSGQHDLSTTSRQESKENESRELNDTSMLHGGSNLSNLTSTTMNSRNNPLASTSISIKRENSPDSGEDSTFRIKTEEIDIDYDPNDIKQEDKEDEHHEGGYSDSTRHPAETKNNFKSEENMDGPECFGKYICSLLRDLPERISSRLQQEITKQVLDAHRTHQNSSSKNH